ncbi:MAG TPA: ATP-dependent Clp protease adaptor ClpS [Gemmataceae bacterium]|nr:ATP-dependent Clp protease adaptor ClpS [Gemmataceae bacterium]
MSKSPNHPRFPSDSAGSFESGRKQPGPLPRFRLVLVNNAAVDLMVVVRTIEELTRFCRAEATHKMWQAHHSGKSLLLLTHLERAELYVEQFKDKGLTVVVEPGGQR